MIGVNGGKHLGSSKKGVKWWSGGRANRNNRSRDETIVNYVLHCICIYNSYFFA